MEFFSFFFRVRFPAGDIIFASFFFFATPFPKQQPFFFVFFFLFFSAPFSGEMSSSKVMAQLQSLSDTYNVSKGVRKRKAQDVYVSKSSSDFMVFFFLHSFFSLSCLDPPKDNALLYSLLLFSFLFFSFLFFSFLFFSFLFFSFLFFSFLFFLSHFNFRNENEQEKGGRLLPRN